MRIWLIYLLAPAIVLLAHCGVKGDPLPPLQPHVPENVSDKFGDANDLPTNSKSSAEEVEDN
jgi:hypothetical protein